MKKELLANWQLLQESEDAAISKYQGVESGQPVPPRVATDPDPARPEKK